jgi:ABC-type transporter Mla MlaB component
MSFRIDTASEGTKTIVRIAGELVEGGIEELRKVCRSLETAIALDVSDLHSADSEGLAALQTLIRRGAEVRGESPYIRMLLDVTTAGEE